MIYFLSESQSQFCSCYTMLVMLLIQSLASEMNLQFIVNVIHDVLSRNCVMIKSSYFVFTLKVYNIPYNDTSLQYVTLVAANIHNTSDIQCCNLPNSRNAGYFFQS